MKVAPEIAARYLLGGRNRYARFISWISLSGLALGVLVLSVVVSVMNGLDAELRSRILGTVPHVMVASSAPDLGSMQGVRSAYRFFSAAGMVTGNGTVVPVSIFGVDSGDAALLPQVGENMLQGTLGAALAQPRAVVMGMPLAHYLALTEGDTVVLVVPEPVAAGVRPRLKRFRLAGTFEMGAEFDHSLVLVPREVFSEAERHYLGTDGIRVDLDDPMQVGEFEDALRGVDAALAVETWQENFGELFQAVRIEKALMFLILLLVVAVAGFNIVSGQTVLVNDKRGDIAILRTMGADGRLIARVFLWQGIGTASLGIAVGLVLGALVAANIGYLVGVAESWLGFRILEGSYFITLPSLVLVEDLLLIGFLSWLLCVLAAWLPARRAARQNPVAGLHV